MLGMDARSLSYLYFPLIGNGFLAGIAFLVFPDQFTGNPGLCYMAAGLGVVAGLTPFIGFLTRDVGAVRMIVGLFGQVILLVLLFAGLYRGFGLRTAAAELAPLLEWDIALYFSLVTWTTLGYGDLQPVRELQLLAALEAFLGYTYLGLIVGLVANRLSGRRGSGEQQIHDHPE